MTFRKNNEPEKTVRAELKDAERAYRKVDDKKALNVINPEIEALKAEILKQDSLVKTLLENGDDQWLKEDMILFKLTDRLEKLEAEKKKLLA